MTIHDKRLAAVRPDLADERLKGQVEAARFVAGRPAWVAGGVVDLRRQPGDGAAVDTQLLRGAAVDVFEEQSGWAWVQAKADGYVGYLLASDLVAAQPCQTHVVRAPRSFTYPGPDLRFPRRGELSMGAIVDVTGEAGTRGTKYALLSDGSAMIADHLVPIGEAASDYVSVAEMFVHTPYLWGGASGFGIDCSGIVQLSMRMAGIQVLRDTDQQERSIGEQIDPANGLQRGDLVFWKGHVALVSGTDRIIHATAAFMAVVREPLAAAIARIAAEGGGPVTHRRRLRPD